MEAREPCFDGLRICSVIGPLNFIWTERGINGVDDPESRETLVNGERAL